MRRVATLWCLLLTQLATAADSFGPWHARFLPGGEGLRWSVDPATPLLQAGAPWSMHGWVRVAQVQDGPVLLAGIGDPAQPGARYLGLRDGKLALWSQGDVALASDRELEAGRWYFVAAVFDGSAARLHLGASQAASGSLTTSAATPVLQLAPHDAPWPRARHFGGEIAGFTIVPRALDVSDVANLTVRAPDFALVNFANVSVGWPLQVRQQAGLALPQDPATLPASKAPFPKPRPIPLLRSGPALQPRDTNSWTIANWRLAEAPKVTASPEAISAPGFDASRWYIATVPGTVLTTLIDRGVYPDPDFGLNNLAIPESLARQDYWYRTEFEAPAALRGRQLTLTFKGINYAAEVWLNGERLGAIKGAFIRGIFTVTGKLNAGERNALAVRISPPPHPGIPHEQSIAAGPGENGGAMALDGPTFVATEGWDWVPGIRDRNTGLWQDVVLSASGQVRIGDAQVITRLPLPETTRADLEINVPLENLGTSEIDAEVSAAVGDLAARKSVTLPPGRTNVSLSLTLPNPQLWWPTGYGRPDLYTLQLKLNEAGAESDARAVRFGVREISYELSLFDEQGELRRVEVNPVYAARGERVIDVRHEALKKSPKGWTASLYPGALKSPAVRELSESTLTPHLVLRVNGVRIASRGGNWGMDDSRKRVARERLEPYFRLHREANLNTIRNWMGQNTEDVFYELADEYGLLVLNDFWASTQDFQLEPEDPALFLANARDVIQRYRNHPSIALWFGRNEGVPQPILNSGLADLVAEVDGTRHFTGSSNRVNLQGSGPYNYRPPSGYFTGLAEGYSVEVGTPSLATLESLRAWNAAPDQWPISDSLAYHDWHQGGNGDVATFMSTLATQFGAAASLEDFERKAQMMNYVTHRAMFEGFNAHLWSRNSGRLLWMTHPAWPSHAWQIYSSDYDTHAAFYGVKKASRAVHVQMNLPDYQLAVVNNTLVALDGVVLHSRVYSLSNRLLDEKRQTLNARANSVTSLEKLNLPPLLEAEGVVLVKLELRDARGAMLADNFYWQAKDEAAHRKLNELPQRKVQLEAISAAAAGEVRVRVKLHNLARTAVLANKLTLLNTDGTRVLPAYYSDNYVSLLPGEQLEVGIAYPASAARTPAVRVAHRAWNAVPTSIAVRSVR